MASLDDRPAGSPLREDSPPGAGNSIPPRSRHRPAFRSGIPPQPSFKKHTIRLATATAIGVLVMILLLLLATQYAQRDWSRKNQLARSKARPLSAPAPVAAAETNTPAASGWTYALRAAAAPRLLQRLAADRHVPNYWLILARGLSSKENPQTVMAALRMALATAGESAQLRNDMGAALFQQKRTKEAALQFHAAEQIEPGFAPTRFNQALESIAARDPEQAVRRLGQYLGQRPEDLAALRLQSTLLTQLGRPQEALRMLEVFLRDQSSTQPLFLEAAMLSARLGHKGNAIRYLETALNGNPVQTVIRAYQSPAFRAIRLSGEGDELAARMADKARAAFGTPVPVEEIQPLLAAPDAKLR